MQKTQKITVTEQPITNDHNEDDYTYVFEEKAKDAINAALLINRPLLIRGEPGIGKSQLAKAAAAALGRTYIPFMINANTESQDLLWSFDAVARLAEAQIEGALCKNKDERDTARENLALHKYIKPAPLWAALNWGSAKKQFDQTHNKDKSPLAHYYNADKAKENGVLLLIDEIDKANSSVPNGLLEVLGANRFHPDGLDKPVEQSGIPPLIIITTNEEKTLPDAFIRRCLSVKLGLPAGRQQQIEYLVNHAKPNFTDLDKKLSDESDETILEAVANIMLDDRKQANDDGLRPLPGQAEYFDLLRGINKTHQENKAEDIHGLIQKLAQFTSKKHPDLKINREH